VATASTYHPANTDRISLTNTNQLVIHGTIGNGLTVTLSANLGTVVYSTNPWATVRNVQFPPMGLASEIGRTNNASGVVEILNDGRATNRVSNGNTAFSNYLDQTSKQMSSNKVFLAPTNIGGLGDGNRFTNVVGLNGTNGHARVAPPIRPNFGATNMSWTNACSRTSSRDGHALPGELCGGYNG
jgi:hypothetical protein